MKIILIDNDKPGNLIIKKMISRIPGVEVVGTFQNTVEAYTFIKQNKVDMAFIDINLPGENGLDFAKRIDAETLNIALAFLTAHSEYALDAFSVNALDYIVKPATQERLENSIKRALARYKPDQKANSASSFKLFAYCLGGMEIKCENGGDIYLGSSKSYELLAYLLLKKGRFTSKWSIINDVFHDMPVLNAETYLNTTIYKIRKSLNAFGLKFLLVSANGSYKFDIANVYIDFLDFENQISQINDMINPDIQELIRVEKLFAGELLGEIGYNWSLPEKERLNSMYLAFVKKLAVRLFNEKDMDSLLRILKRANALNELDEDIVCMLLKTYYAKKDKSLLEKQYKNYTRVLRKELGVEPGPETNGLYNVLLKSFK